MVEGEGVLCARKCLILVRDVEVRRDLRRVLGTKEQREAEKRAAGEFDDNKDNGNEGGGGGMKGAPLDYYDDLADLYSIGAFATTVFRDGNGGANYTLAPTSVAGASGDDSANIRGGNGSWGNFEDYTEVG